MVSCEWQCHAIVPAAGVRIAARSVLTETMLPSRSALEMTSANLYLSLADAPFDREDSTLNPAAGA